MDMVVMKCPMRELIHEPPLKNGEPSELDQPSHRVQQNPELLFRLPTKWADVGSEAVSSVSSVLSVLSVLQCLMLFMIKSVTVWQLFFCL